MNGIVCIPSPESLAEHKPGHDAAQMGPSAVDHFLLGPENRLAEAAVCALFRSRSSPYNPLLLCGPSGCGKSHLARAIAGQWRVTYPRSRVLCETATGFTRQFQEALEIHALEDFRERYRTADLLILEDLLVLEDPPGLEETTQLAGSQPAQQELVHTLDALLSPSIAAWCGQVVVTSRAAPDELPNLMPALKGRLHCGLTLQLCPPTAETRLAILQNLARRHDIDLPHATARMLASAPTLDVRELEATLTRLAARAQLDDHSMTAGAVGDDPLLRATGREFRLEDIAAETARFFALRLADLRGKARRRPVATARGVAMYLARLLTHRTLQQIGQYFGGRDHTTVMYACRKTEALLTTDPTIRQSVQDLRRRLNSPGGGKGNRSYVPERPATSLRSVPGSAPIGPAPSSRNVYHCKNRP